MRKALPVTPPVLFVLLVFGLGILVWPGEQARADWYYKPGYVDYCPNGMPDFSQLQDFSQPPDGSIDQGYCGPVAVANCFWWFDSKFEPNPVPPPGVSDGYPLVYSYGAWDDHAALNVQPFVAALGVSFNTNMMAPGTNIVDMHNGILAWLASRQLDDDYTVNTYYCPQFEWDFLAHEVHRSQDVILLLGFYLAINGDPMNCCRIGGHYVTIAGVDSANLMLAISDPFLDMVAPEPPSHNSAANVSHDQWQVGYIQMCPQVMGCMFLPGYPGQSIAYDFYYQNGGATCPQPPPPGPIFTVIEAAEIICPKEAPPIDSCEYYKPRYNDYTPNGVPDFDQKQYNWFWQGGQWSHCGPVALANCLWWLDSKFETAPVDPRPFMPNVLTPPPNDHFNLVLPYGQWDDHDTNNVHPLVDSLARYIGTNLSGPTVGTNVMNIPPGVDAWLTKNGLDDQFTIALLPGPPYELIRDEVKRSQDVILLLGFYEEQAPGFCCRLGGHYVTVAGVCTTSMKLCLSDPYFDKNEGEPPAGSAHASGVHNDANFVSGPHGTINHDIYPVQVMPAPCPPSIAICELPTYPSSLTDVSMFFQQNFWEPPMCGYQGGPIRTLIEWAIIICPCEVKIGDANNNGKVNIADATYIINLVFVPGSPAPVPYAIASGDASCNGRVNVADATYIINYVFVPGSPPPCDCMKWLQLNGPPLR